MKLKECIIKNFGSYKSLSFNFEDIGLGLVHGATGSGKSTLEDIPLWILFGVTAKNGSVEEVRNWTSKEATSGLLRVETASGIITVVRIRGSSRENDLYWKEDEKEIRGKDITDTQKLLEKRLGVSSDIFYMASHFNEFSDTANFFTSKPKDKRSLFEKIANLELAVNVAEKALANRKETRKQLEEAILLQAKKLTAVEHIGQALIDNDDRTKDWINNQTNLMLELSEKSMFFDIEKERKVKKSEDDLFKWDTERAKKLDSIVDKLDELDQKMVPNEQLVAKLKEAEKNLIRVCPKCNRLNTSDVTIDSLKNEKLRNDQYHSQFLDYSERLRDLQESVNPFISAVENAKNTENRYSLQFEEQKAIKNPFIEIGKDLESKLEVAQKELEVLILEVTKLKHRQASLTKLLDISYELRGVLLRKAVQDVQNSTNRYLERYFDSAIRVGFQIDGADSLEVTIHKDVHQCVYTQLSKGQRQMLRLCFAVSVMAAASNKSGIHFENLFMDEALDGLDGDLKIKSYGLFEELSKSHNSILLIEHNEEFKTLFSKTFHVYLEGDESYIE